ncbi:MAG TPA: aminotransferase class V-fold PLP-dependent enzyme [Candidatus Paceibacterota bacterium]
MRKKRVYLDWASAAPISKKSAKAFAQALGAFGNPSSAHEEGRQAAARLEEARRAIAALVEAKADDVIFTSGATEANALAIRGHVGALMQAGRAARDIHLLYAPTAHASVIKNVEALAREGVHAEPLPLLSDGRVDVQVLGGMLRKETALVSMDAVCGETGVIGNTREVRQMLERAPSAARPLLHVDASQAPLTERITRSHWGADLLVLDAQKIGGVRGIGVLVAHRTIALAPVIEGGGQERGVRSGTQTPALALSFAEALAEAVKGREVFRARAQRARETVLGAVASIPGCVLNEGKETVPHVTNLSLIGRDTDYLAALLDEAGFAVSTRSACETDSSGSRVVLAQTGDPARAASTLRISWGPATAERELARFAQALRHAIAFLDEHKISS